MKEDWITHKWKIIEGRFHPTHNCVSESIFSLGNGRMGLRGGFEEQYSGKSLQGHYLGGVYYMDHEPAPDAKGHRPKKIVRLLNAPNWIGIHIAFDGEILDLAQCEIVHFRRELHLRKGLLKREFIAQMKSGRRVKVNTQRFCSLADDRIGAIRYRITPLNFSATLTLRPYLDAAVNNADTEEQFWVEVDTEAKRRSGYILAETKKTQFQVYTAMRFAIFRGEQEEPFDAYRLQREKYIGCEVDMVCRSDEPITIFKYAAVITSVDHPKEELARIGKKVVKKAGKKGFDRLRKQHTKAWKKRWSESDIRISGSKEDQQAIRFNIFHLHQTYTGKSSRLSISPKGYTGEKYGGCTYWDTEMYCLPFYLATAEPSVARNLLLYRYFHLPKAIENAARLGFEGGAALYPMVTIDGEEAHSDWEVTLEEIHRNGALVYAIFSYIRYTGDNQYLEDYGLEILIAIARFWAQRTHYSPRRDAYLLHGVTGPNEYENNVNNNWYTNYLARWCLRYTLDSIETVKHKNKKQYKEICRKTAFREIEESRLWKKISKQLYLPEEKKLGIFIQHDSFLEKELLSLKDLPKQERPIRKHWTWDRVLRSVFLKQADVLQGLYCFEEHFDRDTIARNFEFYECRTVHESPLSPCVHSVLAAYLGKIDQAFDFYRRIARLDLDNLRGDSEDGLHITTMAGCWIALVKGFGGMRIGETGLSLAPILPKPWKVFAFKLRFRKQLIAIKVSRNCLTLINHSSKGLRLKVYDKIVEIPAHQEQVIDR